MKNAVVKTSIASLFLSVGLVAGCGGDEENTVITGDLTEVKKQIADSQQAYSESMADSYKNDPAR